MTYALHVSGDCGPGCQPCANECAGCLQWLHECTCPQLPIDEGDADVYEPGLLRAHRRAVPNEEEA